MHVRERFMLHIEKNEYVQSLPGAQTPTIARWYLVCLRLGSSPSVEHHPSANGGESKAREIPQTQNFLLSYRAHAKLKLASR